MSMYLFFRAIEIAERFIAIIDEDAKLDSAYKSNCSEIATKYQSKIDELSKKNHKEMRL